MDEEGRLPEESMSTPVFLVVEGAKQGYGTGLGWGVMAFRLVQGLTWLAVAEKFVLGGGSI